MSLLREETMVRLRKAIALRRERRQAVQRRASFGADGSAVPTNMVKLEGDDAALFLRAMKRKAQREQEGFTEGTAATDATQVPAVREKIEALEQ